MALRLNHLPTDGGRCLRLGHSLVHVDLSLQMVARSRHPCHLNVLRLHLRGRDPRTFPGEEFLLVGCQQPRLNLMRLRCRTLRFRKLLVHLVGFVRQRGLVVRLHFDGGMLHWGFRPTASTCTAILFDRHREVI